MVFIRDGAAPLWYISKFNRDASESKQPNVAHWPLSSAVTVTEKPADCIKAGPESTQLPLVTSPSGPVLVTQQRLASKGRSLVRVAVD